MGTVKMQDVVPKLSVTPGRVNHAGPSLGEHNEAVYGGFLGCGPEELADLKKGGVI
jgi:crotonobetainyl-CoA:carnitine CoA-transferase CaiB-like acyl-CoA transferase